MDKMNVHMNQKKSVLQSANTIEAVWGIPTKYNSAH
nr:MAG TPA: hypothetical protein [Caudoviricetes sp.]